MEAQNHLTKLVKFFGVSLQQFSIFWKTLTNEEKEQYKSEIDKWDQVSEFVK